MDKCETCADGKYLKLDPIDPNAPVKLNIGSCKKKVDYAIAWAAKKTWLVAYKKETIKIDAAKVKLADLASLDAAIGEAKAKKAILNAAKQVFKDTDEALTVAKEIQKTQAKAVEDATAAHES